jgi:hypothetical protein
VPAASAPAEAPAASASANPAGADLQSAFAQALSETPKTVTVTVHVTPKGSIIFEHGRRIGMNTVQINVEHGEKKRLVALMDGYAPRRIVVDDSAENMDVELTRDGSAPPPAGASSPAEGATRPPVGPSKTNPRSPFDPNRDDSSR